MLEGQPILTNAHLATYAIDLEVQPFQTGRTYRAEVVGLTEPTEPQG